MILINMNSINDSLKTLTTGGEKIQSNLIHLFKQKFVNAEYINVYATTETPGSLLYSKSEYFTIPEKYSNLIKLTKHTAGTQSMLNDLGEIQLEDEWYNTNDIIEFIDDDRFKFISRKNGYINSGGYRIDPSEIENIISKIFGVVNVHVYGKSN